MAGATVTLKNRTKQQVVLNIPAELAPELAQDIAVGTTRHDPRTGNVAVQAVRRRIGGSVTLRPKGAPDGGDERAGLPLQVQDAPEVGAARMAQRIDVLVVEPAPPAKARPEPKPALPQEPPLLAATDEEPDNKPPRAERATIRKEK